MKDKFGNVVDENCGYARGSILKSEVEENYKALGCRQLIKKRVEQKGIDSIVNVQGLSAIFPITGEDLKKATEDYIGPTFYQEKLDKLALDYMGGNPARHSVTFFCRSSAAIVATILTLVGKGTKVISFTPPPRSHSSITLGTKYAGAELKEVFNIDDYKAALSEDISLAVITSLTVGMKKMSNDDLKEAVRSAKEKNIKVLLDDASGGGFRPFLWEGPRSLELDVDLAIKSVQKSAIYGPRAGMLGGKKDLIGSVAALGYELGMDVRAPIAVAIMRALENFDPEEVRRTKKYCDELYELAVNKFGKNRLETMDVGGINILEENCLEILIEKAKGKKPVLTPQEAAVSVAMALQQDYGMTTVASRAGPGCNWSIRVKPLYSEHVKMKSEEIINAIDASFERVAKICGNRIEIGKLLFGEYMGIAFSD